MRGNSAAARPNAQVGAAAALMLYVFVLPLLKLGIWGGLLVGNTVAPGMTRIEPPGLLRAALFNNGWRLLRLLFSARWGRRYRIRREGRRYAEL